SRLRAPRASRRRWSSRKYRAEYILQSATPDDARRFRARPGSCRSAADPSSGVPIIHAAAQTAALDRRSCPATQCRFQSHWVHFGLSLIVVLSECGIRGGLAASVRVPELGYRYPPGKASCLLQSTPLVRLPLACIAGATVIISLLCITLHPLRSPSTMDSEQRAE